MSANPNELTVSDKYLDLDACLAMNTTITCTVNSSIDPEFFPLVGAKTPATIDAKGVKVEVPLWMVNSIKKSCEINVPKAYNDAVQTVLAANATHVNLKQMQQHFYDVGIYLSGLFPRDEARKLTECMLQTFVQRIGDILLKALHGDKKSDKIDVLETRLFDEVIAMRAELIDYMGGPQTLKKRRAV